MNISAVMKRQTSTVREHPPVISRFHADELKFSWTLASLTSTKFEIWITAACIHFRSLPEIWTIS